MSPPLLSRLAHHHEAVSSGDLMEFQVPRPVLGRVRDRDIDIAPQPEEEFEQAIGGKLLQPPSENRGNFRLIGADQLGRPRLCQPAPADRRGDDPREFHFQHILRLMRQVEIGEDIAAALMHRAMDGVVGLFTQGVTHGAAPFSPSVHKCRRSVSGRESIANG